MNLPLALVIVAPPVLLALGWSASTFNFLHSRSLYDAEAERVEQLAAKIAQRVADALKKPGA